MFSYSGVQITDGAADVQFVTLGTFYLVYALPSVAQVVLQWTFFDGADGRIFFGLESGSKVAGLVVASYWQVDRSEDSFHGVVSGIVEEREFEVTVALSLSCWSRSPWARHHCRVRVSSVAKFIVKGIDVTLAVIGFRTPLANSSGLVPGSIELAFVRYRRRSMRK